MSLKREADPFIKPDPDAKRVKTEGGDGNLSLSSIPMAPPPATFASATSWANAPKVEGGDRKPLGPTPSFGGNPAKNHKKKFFGNSIKVRRGDDWVSAHFNKKTMVVHFTMQCAITKKWPSVEVEKEIFKKLNKAKFDIQPVEDWGFLDRKYFAAWDGVTIKPDPAAFILDWPLKVSVRKLSTKKLENSPAYFKEEKPLSQPKSEHFG